MARTMHAKLTGMAPSNGFTYLGLMIALAIMALVTAMALQLGSVAQRRMTEEALLDIGTEFQNALLSYAKATPAGQPTAPRSLNDLLRDPRYPQIRRHLRKLYADPLTGEAQWGIVMSPDGKGILAIHSLSEDRPIKIANFAPRFQDFAGARSYKEWKFAVPSIPSLSKTASSMTSQPKPTSITKPFGSLRYISLDILHFLEIPFRLRAASVFVAVGLVNKSIA